MSRVLRAFCALLSLSVVSVLGPVLAASPAEASITILCKGYDGCKAAGMGNAGYKSASSTMYWRMYAGHNCTNYAAYRMVKSGLPNVRPWVGSGNAMYWGESNPTLANAVPMVGAVAWWDANIKPASGSAGHVAYVEQVVSADEIIVSQDSWGGDFSWARIVRSGNGWPSGFIHFNDVQLKNKVAPTLSGTPRVGVTLTATPGTWKQSAIAIGYQWTADGVDIAGATAPTYTPTQAEQGKAISVRVTASKLGYPTVVLTTAATAAVEPGEITNTAAPTITGGATVDSQLVASAGQWNPAPTAVAYQWLADGAPIPDATDAKYTPRPEDIGKVLTVVVAASKAGYLDVRATSAPTQPVAPGTIARKGKTLLVGDPRLGETLTLDAGSFAPGDTQMSVQWRRSGADVPGATGSSYDLTAADLGARVSARLTYTKPGYTTVVTRVPLGRFVKTVPVIRTSATPGAGRVGLEIKLAAPGVDRVRGTVRIKSAGEVVKELTLRKGAATTTVRGLEAGQRTLKIEYVASRKVAGTTLVREVHVR